MKAALLAAALAFAAVTLPVATVSAMPQLAPNLAGTDGGQPCRKGLLASLASPSLASLASLASQMVMSRI